MIHYVQKYIKIEGNTAWNTAGTSVTDNSNGVLAYILSKNMGYSNGVKNFQNTSEAQNAIWAYINTWYSNVGDALGANWSYDNNTGDEDTEIINDAKDYANSIGSANTTITDNTDKSNISTTAYNENGKSYVRVGPFNWNFEGSLSNFAGGVMILIMKPFTVGDYIESNGVEGTVYKIDIFYTSLKTVDNKSVKLPNGTLSNSILTNYSMNEKRRVDVEVGIGYDDNIERIQDVWQDADGVRPVTGLGADELPAQVRNTPEEDVTDQENQQGTGDAGAEVHKPPQQRILRLAAKGTTLCFHIKHAPF